VLKLAADSREAAPGKGACWLPTSMLPSSRPKGGQHDTITKEDYRNGWSGEVRRQRSLGSAGAGKLSAEGFAIMSISPRPFWTRQW
jgi:hypothetical protein